MTPRWARFKSSKAAGAAILFVAATAIPVRALAQACCAGGAVVSPTRLAPYEDAAVGLQLRARTNQGSFDAAGHYAASTGLEQVLEQDLSAAVRFAGKAQVGVAIPIVQTHRRARNLDDWGGGLGDTALTGRYDVRLATDSQTWPGIGILAAATLPTGTPPDQAHHLLAADATGAGTYDATVGADAEKVVGHVYASLSGWLTYRFSRAVAAGGGPVVTESFALRWTLLAVGGYVFDNEAALGFFINALDEGAATINGARDATTTLRLTTVGAAGVLPLRDRWRLQGSLFLDVPLSSFGRNEPAGYGLTASLVRVWL
ncbi:MAG TPA: hypothetical protein VGL59_16195 [Polyangia bacterium]|jgi:hypothetical protein